MAEFTFNLSSTWLISLSHIVLYNMARIIEAIQVLCLVRERPGHKCATAVLAVLVVLWEGVPRTEADELYDLLARTLQSGGMPTNRRCALNDQRTCACQGMDDREGGEGIFIP